MSHRQPLVYQLDPCVSAPRRVAGQLVVDESDPEHPYTITFHCKASDLNLPHLIAAGLARPLTDPAALPQPSTPLQLRLIS